MIIVSACLMGRNCKYNGGNNLSPAVRDFVEGKTYMEVCPEEAGGLSAPRPPCEIRGGRVYNSGGEDLTEAFIQGAEAVCLEARRRAEEAGEEIELAILKEQSPSCGSKRVYDGSFSGRKIEGQGILAALLRENGIQVISEEEIEK